MTASALVRNPMDNSVGATLCSRRQRSLSGIFEYGDLKWYNIGDAESTSPLSQDIYDTRRSRDTLLDEDEDSLFDNVFDHIYQCLSQDESPKRKQKKRKFLPNPTDVDATKFRLGYHSIDNEDTAKMSSSTIDHVPCLFPLSDIKTDESSFEENPSSYADLAGEEEENLLIALCKQSLASATEILADTCQEDPKVTSITSIAVETQCDADENEGDLQKYIAIADSLVVSTLTSRERALYRNHCKRKRILRRNKKRSEFARFRSRKKGRFTSIYSKCCPNKG